MFRINGDISDAKNEKHWVNIKWSVAWKRILQVNICVDPNWINWADKPLITYY